LIALGIGVTVARLALNQLVKVQILDPQFPHRNMTGISSDAGFSLRCAIRVFPRRWGIMNQSKIAGGSSDPALFCPISTFNFRLSTFSPHAWFVCWNIA
jgi:hypothetical protein